LNINKSWAHNPSSAYLLSYSGRMCTEWQIMWSPADTWPCMGVGSAGMLFLLCGANVSNAVTCSLWNQRSPWLAHCGSNTNVMLQRRVLEHAQLTHCSTGYILRHRLPLQAASPSQKSSHSLMSRQASLSQRQSSILPVMTPGLPSLHLLRSLLQLHGEVKKLQHQSHDA
jgi:hypothetical protein